MWTETLIRIRQSKVSVQSSLVTGYYAKFCSSFKLPIASTLKIEKVINSKLKYNNFISKVE